MGRPSGYSDAMGAMICQRIAEGESLRKICLEDGMPAQSTVFKWIADNETFSKQYACARELQMELMAEEILEIADETSGDTVITISGPKPDAEWIQRSKLRVDTRKWLMSKMAPKKYGDKISAELSGPDGGKIPLSLEIDL